MEPQSFADKEEYDVKERVVELESTYSASEYGKQQQQVSHNAARVEHFRGPKTLEELRLQEEEDEDFGLGYEDFFEEDAPEIEDDEGAYDYKEDVYEDDLYGDENLFYSDEDVYDYEEDVYEDEDDLFDTYLPPIEETYVPRPRERVPRRQVPPHVSQIGLEEFNRAVERSKLETKSEDMLKNFQAELKEAQDLEKIKNLAPEIQQGVQARRKVLETTIKNMENSMAKLDTERQEAVESEKLIEQSIENIRKQMKDVKEGDRDSFQRLQDLLDEMNKKEQELAVIRNRIYTRAEQHINEMNMDYTSAIEKTNDIILAFLNIEKPDETDSDKAIRKALIELVENSDEVISVKRLYTLGDMAASVVKSLQNQATNVLDQSEATKQTISNLEAQKAALENDKKDLQKQLEASKKRIQELGVDNALQERVDKLEAEKAKHAEELENVVAERDRLQEENRILNSQMQQITDILGPVSRTESNSTIAQRFQTYVANQIQAKEQNDKSISAANKQITDVQSIIDNIDQYTEADQAKLREFLGVSKEQEAKNEILQQIEAQLGAIQLKKDGAVIDYANITQKLAHVINIFGDIPRITAEAKKETIREIFTAINSNDLERIDPELKRVIEEKLLTSAQTAALADSWTKLTTAFAEPDFLNRTDLGEFGTKIQNLIRNRENEATKKANEDLTKSRDELRKANENINKLKEELRLAQASSTTNEALRNQLATANTTLTEANSKLKEANDKVASLAKDLKEKQELVTLMEQQKKSLENANKVSIELMETERQQALEKLKEVEDKLADAIKKNKEQAKTITGNKTKYDKALEEMAKLHEETLKKEREVARAINDNALKELRELKGRMRDKIEELHRILNDDNPIKWGNEESVTELEGMLAQQIVKVQRVAAAKKIASNRIADYEKMLKEAKITGFKPFSAKFIKDNLIKLQAEYPGYNENELVNLLQQTPIRVDENGLYKRNGNFVMNSDAQFLEDTYNQFIGSMYGNFDNGRRDTRKKDMFSRFKDPEKGANNRGYLHAAIQNMYNYRMNNLAFVKNPNGKSINQERVNDENFNDYVMAAVYARVINALGKTSVFDKEQFRTLLKDQFNQVMEKADKYIFGSGEKKLNLTNVQGLDGHSSLYEFNKVKKDIARYGIDDNGNLTVTASDRVDRGAQTGRRGYVEEKLKAGRNNNEDVSLKTLASDKAFEFGTLQ